MYLHTAWCNPYVSISGEDLWFLITTSTIFAISLCAQLELIDKLSFCSASDRFKLHCTYIMHVHVKQLQLHGTNIYVNIPAHLQEIKNFNLECVIHLSCLPFHAYF